MKHKENVYDNTAWNNYNSEFNNHIYTDNVHALMCAKFCLLNVVFGSNSRLNNKMQWV